MHLHLKSGIHTKRVWGIHLTEGEETIASINYEKTGRQVSPTSSRKLNPKPPSPNVLTAHRSKKTFLSTKEAASICELLQRKNLILRGPGNGETYIVRACHAYR